MCARAALQIRGEVVAIQRVGCGHASYTENGGKNIPDGYDVVLTATGCNRKCRLKGICGIALSPANEHRDTHTAFPLGGLLAPKWKITECARSKPILSRRR